ncbi:RagB/SusD family nutrient uptake outer membrane protein [Polaribacter sejongensis]|uniref:RagB/SusD family nutrient uptake outer membrane protein n=1 Tax=Polaribacter sejongensis TaxID=985043 RepID=UPI001AD80E3F|nr:RagB/SusD family nutrient uptake outer membrane protein [Polaribacter sejongensis]
MKNIQYKIKKIGLTAIVTAFMFAGCSEYLDQEPLDSVTEAVYFTTPEQFELAANYFYRQSFGYDDGDQSSDLSGNLEISPSYGQGQTSIPTSDGIWNNNYDQMREANQLIEKAAEYDGNQSEITSYVATAHFFRAWNHYKLLLRFGGVPIVTRSLDVDSEELLAPRNSRYEVVNQIFIDLDVAIAGLPSENTIPDSEKGKLSTEAAKSFKARILLYEATWEKYVGTATDGDGLNVGAGSNKPAGYPSVEEMLTEAKQQSLAVINSAAYQLWDHRAEFGDRNLFYLFSLEDDGSNPAGLSKANNREFIIQTVYDNPLRRINQNLTHSKKHTPSRKLMDMYLCSDGLPVQHSSVFEGYDEMISEFQNRDYRLTSFVSEPLKEYWGWGNSTNGGGAQYGVDFADAGTNFDYRYVPQLTSPAAGRNIGYQGVKLTTEDKGSETKDESFNYPHLRYAEVLLTYAEASVELGGGAISDSDLDISINKIRERSNVAPLTNALITPYADLNMLGEIRRERAIELFGENQRFNDLKRWGIAEEELSHAVSTTYVIGTEFETAVDPKNPSSTIYNPSAFSYGTTTTEQSVSSYAGIATTKPGALILDISGNRNFSISNYIDPIPSVQIDQNPELLQNPGW